MVVCIKRRKNGGYVEAFFVKASLWGLTGAGITTTGVKYYKFQVANLNPDLFVWCVLFIIYPFGYAMHWIR